MLAPSSASIPLVSASLVLDWLDDGDEVALLDVREHGEYGEGHPFFAVHLPYSQLETEVLRLVPRREARTVLFDQGLDGNALALKAARRLQAVGYTAVKVLDGGTAAWAATGRSLFQGVNLPSKTFGEIAEHAFEVPHIGATELAGRVRRGEPLVLLDGRTLAEHRKMTIPGAIPVPNGELALRWPALVPDARTPIVVHCAGRTRSIVGAQILRDLGLPNPILALENGTQGWALAGLNLERGSTRSLPAAPPSNQAASEALARSVFADMPGLSVEEAQRWVDDPARTTFVFDVRTAAEFAIGTVPHARHAEGGQLLQATDLHVGVRHARLLLLDDDGVRAPVIAGWLRRLGWEAAHVVEGIRSGLRVPAPRALDLPTLRSTDAIDDRLAIDLRGSQAFRRSHTAGSRWSIRPRLVADVDRWTDGDRSRALLLIADAPEVAALAAQDLHEAGWNQLAFVSADSLRAAGQPQQATPDEPSDVDSIDYLFFVHDRHEGNLDAARRYLDWETGLIAQCAPEELAVFRAAAASAVA